MKRFDSCSSSIEVIIDAKDSASTQSTSMKKTNPAIAMKILLRQMTMAAKAIGNVELEEKFEASLKGLERERSIIFNPSLYLAEG